MESNTKQDANSAYAAIRACLSGPLEEVARDILESDDIGEVKGYALALVAKLQDSIEK